MTNTLRERIGIMGDTYEYSKSGRRLAGTDRQTFDELLEFSRTWPETYHQWVGVGGGSRWARAGREVVVGAGSGPIKEVSRG